MLLVQLMHERPDELAADLMERYGVDIEAASEGAHSATLVAALAAQLPQDCRWRVAYDPDMWWTGDRMLAANLINTLNGLAWGLSDPKKRGSRPKPVGPSWVDGDGGRKVKAKGMTSGELMERLSRRRKASRKGGG